MTGEDISEVLASLAALHADGTLNDDEYARAKAAVLEIPSHTRPPTPVARRRPAMPWVIAGVVLLLALTGLAGFVFVTGRVDPASGAPEAHSPTRGATYAPVTGVPLPQPTSVTPVDALDRQLAVDSPTVEQLVGSWVPQLSAKRVGAVVDGVAYDHDEIEAHVSALERRFPGALLVWSGDYASFREPDFYIVVMAVPFDSGDSALGWCVEQGLGPDDCFAKRLSHSGDAASNTMYQR